MLQTNNKSINTLEIRSVLVTLTELEIKIKITFIVGHRDNTVGMNGSPTAQEVIQVLPKCSISGRRASLWRPTVLVQKQTNLFYTTI